MKSGTVVTTDYLKTALRTDLSTSALRRLVHAIDNVRRLLADQRRADVLGGGPAALGVSLPGVLSDGRRDEHPLVVAQRVVLGGRLIREGVKSGNAHLRITDRRRPGRARVSQRRWRRP